MVGDLVGYSDSDWASDLDRKFVSSYMFKLWCTYLVEKQETDISCPLYGGSRICCSLHCEEEVWLKQLLSELQIEQSKPTVVYEDNQSAISMAQNAQFHGRTKHIDIRHHFVREKVKDGTIEVKYVALIGCWPIC